MNRATLALVVLALVLFVQPSHAGWVYWDGGIGYYVPPVETGAGYGAPGQVVSVTPPPLTITQPFTGEGTLGGGSVTGTFKAGYGALLQEGPAGKLFADVYSDYVSISGTPDPAGSGGNPSGLPVAFVFHLIVNEQALLDEPYHGYWYTWMDLQATGYLAPGDRIEYWEVGSSGFSSGYDAGSAHMQLGTGEIDTPGPFSLSLSVAPILLGFTGGLDSFHGASVEFEVVIFKGFGGGTTIWDGDPGVGVFSPQASPPTDAVPEPASLTLLGLGAAGLLGYGWRRRKQ